MTNEETKTALKMCGSFGEFDKIMNRTWCKSDADKLAYLSQLFGTKTDNHINRHTAYIATANTVMNKAC